MARTFMGETITLAEARRAVEAERNERRVETRAQAIRDVLELIEREKYNDCTARNPDWRCDADSLTTKLQEMLDNG